MAIRPSVPSAEYPQGIDWWHHPRLARWAGWAVILLAALLYLATLDTGLRPDELSGGDLITHQYAQAQARPSNAPGYPIYTMGGWLWFHLTRPLFGWALNPVQRLASYSTLWALLSLFVLYRLILRATHGNWPQAALSAAFYGVTYFFWFYSVTTEQYTSAIFQTLLIVWLAFKWDEQETRGESGDRYLLGLAFVVGTCLANLVTVLFIAPPLLWFILSRQPGLHCAGQRDWLRRPDLPRTVQRDWLRRPALVLCSVGLTLLPVASYAFVYAQGAAHPEWRGDGQWPTAWAWFVDFLTTHQGRDELAPGLTLAHFFTDEFPALIWGELTWVVLVGGLVGLWWLPAPLGLRRRGRPASSQPDGTSSQPSGASSQPDGTSPRGPGGRRRALFIYGTLAIYALFCWVDRFGNWFQVMMPAYPLVVLGFATGLDVLWRGSRKSGNQGSGNQEAPRPDSGFPDSRFPVSLVTSLILVGLVALVAYRFTVSLPRANQSGRAEDTGLDPGWAVLADQPLAYSVVVGEYDEWLALQYLTTIWDAQPPIYPRPLCRPDLPGPAEGSIPSKGATAVYLTRRAAAADPTCLADQHRYAAGATLIRVQTVPNRQMPESARPADLDFGSSLMLVGYETQTTSVDDLSRSTLHTPRSTLPAPRSPLHWRLSLYWQAATASDIDYTISVRPLRNGVLIPGDDGQPIIQDHQPVWNTYPTSRWSPGEVIRDDYVLSLPGQASPDGALIVVYRVTAEGFENLGEATLALEP